MGYDKGYYKNASLVRTTPFGHLSLTDDQGRHQYRLEAMTEHEGR